jgi:hypothetical protein
MSEPAGTAARPLRVKSNVFGSEPRCNGLLLHAMLGVPPVFVVVEALMCQSRYPKRIAITALALALVAGVQLTAAAGIDPHRPACVDARCRKIMSFLKANYCGESPYGNGPKDSCQIKSPKGPRPGVDVVTDFGCDWSDAKRTMDCKQQGEPPASFRSLLIAELRRLGLPANADGRTYFTIWKSTASGWSLAAADYQRPVGSDVELCQVIVIVDQSWHVRVLRKVPFRKTSMDVPAMTQWSPIDLADVDGDGRTDVILQGDHCEDHWLEAVSVDQRFPRTLFSGLGYYL